MKRYQKLLSLMAIFSFLSFVSALGLQTAAGAVSITGADQYELSVVTPKCSTYLAEVKPKHTNVVDCGKPLNEALTLQKHVPAESLASQFVCDSARSLWLLHRSLLI